MAARKSRSQPVGAALPAIIETDADVAACSAHLVRHCPLMARAFVAAGPPPLRRWANGYPGLVRIIVGQQLSVASATAIHGRLTTLLELVAPDRLLAAGPAALKGAGLSAAKIATLTALSKAVVDGAIAFDALGAAPPDEVRATLTTVRGIGPWTADIYLMFCRGDADAFAPGDLALQVGVQRLMGRDARPDPRELLAIAERWRPARAVAARLVWAYYGLKQTAAASAPV